MPNDFDPIFIALGEAAKGYIKKLTLSRLAGTSLSKVTLELVQAGVTVARHHWEMPGTDAEATIYRVAACIQGEGASFFLDRILGEFVAPVAPEPTPIKEPEREPEFPAPAPPPLFSEEEAGLLPDILVVALQRATPKPEKRDPDRERARRVLDEIGVDLDDEPAGDPEWETFAAALDITQVTSYCEAEQKGLPNGRAIRVWMSNGVSWLLFTTMKKFAIRRAVALTLLGLPVEDTEATPAPDGLQEAQ